MIQSDHVSSWDCAFTNTSVRTRGGARNNLNNSSLLTITELHHDYLYASYYGSR